MDYGQHFELMKALQQDPSIIAQPILYNFVRGKAFAAMMERLAQPLADGSPSPFSSRNPLSGHGQLMGAIAYFQEVLGYEFNLIPC